MGRKIMYLLIIVCFFLICVSQNYALSTYVGVKILNLTDDPASSCANWDEAYGTQGRIRALSSIIPYHPIYFNLSRTLDTTTVWSGNSTKDTDYTIGDIIYLPEPVNLVNDTYYNLMFDIDAIRIYLPLLDYSGFVATADDNYWTAGFEGSDTSKEYMLGTKLNNCTYDQITSYCAQSNIYYFIKNTRENLFDNCMTDSLDFNCDPSGYIGVGGDFEYFVPQTYYDFNADSKYKNLYQSNVGNFLLTFKYIE